MSPSTAPHDGAAGSTTCRGTPPNERRHEVAKLLAVGLLRFQGEAGGQQTLRREENLRDLERFEDQLKGGV
jgi:hypothetical protein